jgi:hypothetical protein
MPGKGRATANKPESPGRRKSGGRLFLFSLYEISVLPVILATRH